MPSAPKPPEAAMAEEDAPAPLRVLLVDPLGGTRAPVIAMLESLGHTPIPVGDWEAAERVLLLDRVEAIVMAFASEGLDGRKVAARLRDGLPPQGELPLVGTTSGLRRGEEEEAREAGFDVLLTRPFTEEELEAALRQAIRDRTPPPALDPAERARLRTLHRPAALAALDDAAMDVPATLLGPLFEEGDEAGYAAAGAAVAEAMESIGAVTAAGLARQMAGNAAEGRNFLFPLMTAVVAVRVALRKDRVAAAAEDPIWAASDTPPGDTP
jgi:CheY-like chemotaxis protein